MEEQEDAGDTGRGVRLSRSFNVPWDEVGDTGEMVRGEAIGRCDVARMSREVTVIPDIETVRL
jgi:hypothetical protein